MNTLTIKIPEHLESALLRASRQQHLPKSELVRRALESYLSRPAGEGAGASSLEAAGDLVGCFAGGPRDLASNPRHLDGFGR